MIVINKGRVLLGKRKNSHGDQTWNFPGGHLEYGEEIIDCARREVLEETGIEIRDPSLTGRITNDIFVKEKKHYITIFVTGHTNDSNPKILEPNKCDGWGWFDWSNLPKPLFLPIENLLEQGFAL